MARSSSTREGWAPRSWPADERAAAQLREWLATPEGERGVGSDLDFSNAELPGLDVRGFWLVHSAFRATVLRDARLGHTHLDRSDFTGADLTGADLTDAEGEGTVLREATLRGAVLRGCEFFGADLSGADLSGAVLADAAFYDTRFDGAQLGSVTADKLVLRDSVFDGADVTGFTGTVVGPIRIVLRGERTSVDGPELEQWFAARGAEIRRFVPRT
ncbi:pentapeptide repeat-containing protein [Amycolatopsis sp. NPDC051903]|uniref:pentapeptide repeat-containing protein n=1 Tax=Amycolatopsis sp. NPDC051903 TaxID=3363936 RepID=UPI003793B528